jgi:hypothetical protein
VILLGRERREGEGLLGVGVIAGGVERVRDVIADHAVLDSLLVARVEVRPDDVTDGGDGGAPVGRERGEVLGDGGGLGLHGARLAVVGGSDDAFGCGRRPSVAQNMSRSGSPGPWKGERSV